jgi:hypothetical protein
VAGWSTCGEATPKSEVIVLGQTWYLGQVWPNRLVRCEVDLDKDKIRFFTLRRQEPTSQPQILEVDYRLPNRGFHDGSPPSRCIGTCQHARTFVFGMYWHLPT